MVWLRSSANGWLLPVFICGVWQATHCACANKAPAAHDLAAGSRRARARRACPPGSRCAGCAAPARPAARGSPTGAPVRPRRSRVRAGRRCGSRRSSRWQPRDGNDRARDADVLEQRIADLLAQRGLRGLPADSGRGGPCRSPDRSTQFGHAPHAVAVAVGRIGQCEQWWLRRRLDQAHARRPAPPGAPRTVAGCRALEGDRSASAAPPSRRRAACTRGVS